MAGNFSGKSVKKEVTVFLEDGEVKVKGCPIMETDKTPNYTLTVLRAIPEGEVIDALIDVEKMDPEAALKVLCPDELEREEILGRLLFGLNEVLGFSNVAPIELPTDSDELGPVQKSCKQLARRACVNLSGLTLGQIREGQLVASGILPATFDGKSVSKAVEIRVKEGNKITITTNSLTDADTTPNYQTQLFELKDTDKEEPPEESVIDFMCHGIMVLLGLTTENAVFKT